MKVDEIKVLLEKYYNGESSLEEEQQLKKFFAADDVPDEFRGEQEIFRFYSAGNEMPEPSSYFENNILMALGTSEGRTRHRTLYTVLSGIAAILIITAGTYFFFIRETSPVDTFSDPEIAYNETMKILYDISAKMNKGTKALGKLELIESETNKGIDKMVKTTSLMNESIKPVGNALDAIRNVELKKENK